MPAISSTNLSWRWAPPVKQDFKEANHTLNGSFVRIGLVAIIMVTVIISRTPKERSRKPARRSTSSRSALFVSEIIRQRLTLTSMLRNSLLSLVVLSSVSLTTPLRAATLAIESGPRKTHLLELFTSEGCSSCPPAEAWLSKLKDNAGLWRDFVPVAFHVDYWDRLGWRDPFASKAWTARQYLYSARWKSSSVYTPAFVLDGREWQNNGVPPIASESPGALKLQVSDDDKIAATFQSTAGESKSLELHVARLGFGLNINVKAGENSGRKLLHDFVVLSLDTAKMVGGKAELAASAAKAQDANSRSAIVAWVTEPGQAEAIQAVGGWVR